MQPIGSYARAYADRGWPVFPCDPATKQPLTRRGFQDAAKDRATVAAWWAEHPDAMIGLPTGPATGVFVVDLDPKDGETADDLLVALAEAIGSQWPAAFDEAPKVITPRGGVHLYFRYPDGEALGNRAGIIPHVDVRGAGGYVIAAPSARADGTTYQVRGAFAELFQAPNAPPALIDMILRRGRWGDQPPQPPAGGGAARAADALDELDEKARRVRAWGLSAFDREIDELRRAPEGTRNDTLNRVAFRLGQLVGARALDEAIARAGLRGVADAWPNRKKSYGTIESGLKGGKAEPADTSAVGERGPARSGAGAPRPPLPPLDHVEPPGPAAPRGEASGGSPPREGGGEPPSGAGGGEGAGGGPGDPGGGAGGEALDPHVLAECAREPQNDLGNARRLIRWFGPDMLIVREVGEHVWNGTHWSGEGGREAFQKLAQTTGERIALEARLIGPTWREQAAMQARDAAVAKRAAGEDLTPADKAAIAKGDEAEDALNKRRGDRRKFSLSCGNSQRITGMITQAAPHITVAPEMMDADPLAINTLSGTIRVAKVPDPECPDEATVRLVWGVRLDAHERADRIAKVMPVRYDPDAECPRWVAFMERFQPKPGIRRFLQAFYGLGLTGLTGEQVFVYHYGLGANGKSTFMELIARIMGGYAQVLPAEAITGDLQRRGDQATPEFARLPGARLVRCSELPRGQGFRESTLKMLTGGEAMLVRNLHKGFFEFRPVFKATGSGNDRPPIGGVDEGIWRRMRLIPWDVTIPPDERRPMEQVLGEFMDEASGILNWLLDGLVDYMTNGLVTPMEIRDATEAYRADMDPVGEFAAACVVRTPGVNITARDMYRAYVAWANANSVKPFSEKNLAIIMTQKGFAKKNGRIREYLDVKLQDVPDDPEAPASHGTSWHDPP